MFQWHLHNTMNTIFSHIGYLHVAGNQRNNYLNNIRKRLRSNIVYVMPIIHKKQVLL